MKHKYFFCAALILLAVLLGAQTIHDPNSEIYRDFDLWSLQGFIKEFSPAIRPYPMPLIESLLEEVINNGDAPAREKAARYREIFAPGSRFIHPGFESALQGKNDEFGFIGGVFAEGTFRLNSMLSGSYNLTFFGLTDENGERFNVPGTYSAYQDFVYDTANIGKLQIAPNWTSLFSIGSENLYFQGGLARTSIGPFFDNGIIVGPQAPRAGHFGFVYWQPRWSYEMLYQTLTATDDFGSGIYPGKSGIIHIINVRPVVALELGFIQTLIWGERFEPLYLMPFTYLFGSQTIIDFDDNALMGLYFRWKPFGTFQANGVFYADDISFNGLFTGEMKIKAAGELGISWAPKRSILSRLDFDYTAIFPYTYTHWPLPNDRIYISGEPNYLNYTHLGKNLGPDLEPNSDRFSLRSSWNTLPNIDLGFSAYLIRHANASAGMDGLGPADNDGANDGSIFDHGTVVQGTKYIKNPYIYAWYLTQDLIEVRLGGSLALTWSLPTSFGIFKLTGEYGAEYGWNRDLINGDNGLDQYWSIGGIWSW